MAGARASIIIPTYNHAAVLGDAIRSCLAQTVTVDVIVVDDGSTDETPAVVRKFGSRVQYVRIPHAGPCVARNTGIDLARFEFLMFLDADDVIRAEKVALQIAALDTLPEIGFVLSDVLIEDEARGRTSTASAQYRYDDKALHGWIQPQLAAANFIPIMSPLIRRSVLVENGIRFDDRRVPEDWHFWYAVAGVARVTYVDRVLSTYRHGKTGRSRIPKATRAVSPTIKDPLRLNLGCGTQGTRSWHPIDGLINLDRSMGWKFEDGLGDFVDGSVAGITVSHALMYVAAADWPAVCSEFARVLRPGGVVRITEDSTDDPSSSRFGGWQGSEPAVTLTSPAFVRRQLEAAGLTVFDVDRASSHFEDGSLCQAQHGDPPDVFFVEGVKRASLLFAPHSDDETLFAAFTVIRHRPHVVICYPSAGDYGGTAERLKESRDAGAILGAAAVEQWEGGTLPELVERMRAIDLKLQPDRVFAPDPDASHPDHCLVAAAAAIVFEDRLTTYHTYRDGERVVGEAVAIEREWIGRKLRALARYETQITHPRAFRFFIDGLAEYYGTKAK